MPNRMIATRVGLAVVAADLRGEDDRLDGTVSEIESEKVVVDDCCCHYHSFYFKLLDSRP